jgi:hypothetical protein
MTQHDSHNVKVCHTIYLVTAGFGDYYVSLVFITCCLLWAAATDAVRYSNTAPQKYENLHKAYTYAYCLLLTSECLKLYSSFLQFQMTHTDVINQ